MTVEELIKVLDKEATFEIFQAYDKDILFDSTKETWRYYSSQEWKEVKDRIVYEFYPTDTRELRIFIYPGFMKTKPETGNN